jgi:hypothetical protein
MCAGAHLLTKALLQTDWVPRFAFLSFATPQRILLDCLHLLRSIRVLSDL